jgi:hypothetical protein
MACRHAEAELSPNSNSPPTVPSAVSRRQRFEHGIHPPSPTSFTNTTFRIRLRSHLDAHRSQFGPMVLLANYARLVRFTDCSGMGLSAVNALGPLLASSMHRSDIIRGVALPAIVGTSLVWSFGRGIEVEESQVICSPLCRGQHRRYNGGGSENKDERREMHCDYKVLLLWCHGHLPVGSSRSASLCFITGSSILAPWSFNSAYVCDALVAHHSYRVGALWRSNRLNALSNQVQVP